MRLFERNSKNSRFTRQTAYLWIKSISRCCSYCISESAKDFDAFNIEVLQRWCFFILSQACVGHYLHSAFVGHNNSDHYSGCAWPVVPKKQLWINVPVILHVWPQPGKLLVDKKSMTVHRHRLVRDRSLRLQHVLTFWRLRQNKSDIRANWRSSFFE